MSNLIKTAAAVAVVAGAAMSASASVKSFGATSPEVFGPRLSLRGVPGGGGIGFEAAEGFALGNIAGQNGWLDNSTVAAPRGTMQVQDGVNDGNGSANALRLSQGPQAQNQFGIAQAPEEGDRFGIGGNRIIDQIGRDGAEAIVDFVRPRLRRDRAGRDILPREGRRPVELLFGVDDDDQLGRHGASRPVIRRAFMIAR